MRIQIDHLKFVYSSPVFRWSLKIIINNFLQNHFNINDDLSSSDGESVTISIELANSAAQQPAEAAESAEAAEAAEPQPAEPAEPQPAQPPEPRKSKRGQIPRKMFTL